MAEDADDETFGDFAFAPFHSNSQFNGPNSLADEDDEWGDFVKSPQQSKPSDPFFKGNHLSDNSVSPPPWVKPTDALPLSIFGDVEEEEDNFAIVGDFNQGRSNAIAGDFKSTFADNNVSGSQNLDIADLYNQYSQIKPENGFGSNSTGRVVSVESGVYSSSNQNAARSAFRKSENVDLNGSIGISDHSELTNNSDGDEFSFKSNVLDPSEKADLFSGWTQEFNGFSSLLNTATPNVKIPTSDIDMNGQKQQLDGSATAIDDDGDEGWEFKDAYSEFRTGEVNNNVDFMAHEVSERIAYSSGSVSGSNRSLDLFGTSNGSIDFFATSNESFDYFATSNGISGASQEVSLVGIQPSTAILNGLNSDTNSNNEQNNINGMLNHNPDGSAEFDEDFGEFTAASAETGPKPGEASTIDVLSPSNDAVSTLDDKIQEKDMKLNYHKGALPLSIFGNEEPEIGGSSDVQDSFTYQSTSDQINNHTPTTITSINDLISSLYSQAEQTSPINTVQKPIKTQLSLSSAVSSSDLVNDADHLDDSSWDFKDASQMRADGEASLYDIGDAYQSISSKLKLNNYLDFYSKLKEELRFVAKCHIESLKQARSDAALSGEDARVASLDSEFQLVCKELEQMNFLSEESNSQDHPSGDSYLNEFVEVLLEPQFQILESEYHLSQKLLLLKKDLRSAMELIRHTTTMLQILTAGTLEEQTTYVCIWSEMISVCSQELKHGASIWNQAVEKHVQSQLLSEPQGRKFVLALGEIYRVVVVLGASAKLFKLWTLSGSVDLPAIYFLLDECHALWSTSGLEEALSSVSASTALDNASLLKSIKYILGLDAFALQNYVFSEKHTLCRLSILTAGVAPGMKMIKWGKEQCFVTLANLWANLISVNPPKLPQLNLS